MPPRTGWSFARRCVAAGLPIPAGGPATSLAEAEAVAQEAGYPLLVRASFALGGSGASWVYRPEELAEAVRKAIAESPIGQAWIEQSIMGWKEYELEVMARPGRQFRGGVQHREPRPDGRAHRRQHHRGAGADADRPRVSGVARPGAAGDDSRGRRDRRLQRAVRRRSGAMAGCHHRDESRASAARRRWPRKATGFPIAKIAALVAVGYTLDEIANDITGQTQAAFEPSLDYVVVKIPRWAFEKFPGVDGTLGPQMKSVGEVMALGSTFPEALQKAVQSLETGVDGLDGSGPGRKVERGEWRVERGGGRGRGGGGSRERWWRNSSGRRQGGCLRCIEPFGTVCPAPAVAEATGMDPWFLAQLAEIVNCRIGNCQLSIGESGTTGGRRMRSRWDFADRHAGSPPAPHLSSQERAGERFLQPSYFALSQATWALLHRYAASSPPSPRGGGPGEGVRFPSTSAFSPAPRHPPHLPAR